MTYFIHGTRTSTIMRKIAEIFAAHTHKTGRKKLFTARFMLDQLPGCTITITKARKLLGVQAKIIAGKHCWLPPTRTLEEGLKILGRGSKASFFKVKKTREERKQAIIPVIKDFLVDIGKTYKYVCPANQALEELRKLTGKGNRLGVYEAKRELGIISEREEGANGIWYWVWRSEEVEEWIMERVFNSPHPVPYETMEKEALALGWGYRVLVHNRPFGVGNKNIDGVWHWTNKIREERLDDHE